MIKLLINILILSSIISVELTRCVYLFDAITFEVQVHDNMLEHEGEEKSEKGEKEFKLDYIHQNYRFSEAIFSKYFKVHAYAEFDQNLSHVKMETPPPEFV